MRRKLAPVAAAAATLLLIITGSMFVVASAQRGDSSPNRASSVSSHVAYFPVGAGTGKSDPAAGGELGQQNVHYAIGTNRVVCYGCEGSQSQMPMPSAKR